MRKNILIWTILLLTGGGCNDFLEPKSQTLFIPRDAVSLDEMLLGAAYPRAGQYSTVLNAGLQLLDDDISCIQEKGGVSSYDEPKANGFKAVFSWRPDMFVKLTEGGAYKDIWESHYRFILGANAALDYVDQVKGTYNEKTLVKAQAYALRAFYFFHLVNIFGEPYTYRKEALGIPLKLNSGTEEKDIPRNTVEEVYRQVVSDLGEAERFYRALPVELQYRPDLRVSLPMVELLKSRVFLYMENWKGAAEYARKVIDGWDFQLFDLNTLAPSATGWSRTYYAMISAKSPEVIWLYGSASADVTPYTLSFTTTNNQYRKLFYASPDLLQGFVAGDLRRDWYIFRESGKDDAFMPYGKLVVSSGNFVDSKAFAAAFRLSEAYLNLAEAAAMEGDEETARRALNTLRSKRFTPETVYEVKDSGEKLVTAIRQERRLELCFEFHRWFDLRRYGMPSFTHEWNAGQQIESYTIQHNDAAYTLPIPEVVMEQNRALLQNQLAEPK